ncbi:MULTISPECIES: FtsQ-type POTRA domain-containing protein [Enorma]|uniref:FtsQ-type POTRA domain-containing protein n=1 Tax=Enorma TaxID=1472762 RepID=UPI00037FDCA7|nr:MULTISPECIES: FtsQ-type POTRA domain-containing protein [Enorma]
MALSSNRKSNSSASRAAKPTYRRAKAAGGKKASVGRAPSAAKKASSAKRPAAKKLAPSKKPAAAKKPVTTKKPAAGAKRALASAPGGKTLKGPAKQAAKPAGLKAKRQGAPAKPALKPTKRITAAEQGGAAPSSKGSARTPASTARAGILGLPIARIGIIAVAALVAAVVIWVVVANSPIFAASDVVVNGSEHVSQEMVERLVDVPDGTTLLNVDTAAIEESLMQNPWVAGVTIERTFPHTLTITPVERKVAAIAYITSGDVAWAIGTDETWIAPISLSVTVDADGNIVSTTGETQEEADAEASGSTEEGTAGGSADAQDGAADTQADGASDDAAAADGTSSDGDAAAGDAAADAAAGDAASDTGGAAATDADTAQDGAASDGNVLTGAQAALAIARRDKAVLFIDIPADVSPASGAEITSDVVLAGLKYADGFSEDFLDQIEDLSLESVEAISANLTSGIEVSLGSPENIALKERVVTELIEQVEGITYINVRDPQSPTYRSV